MSTRRVHFDYEACSKRLQLVVVTNGSLLWYIEGTHPASMKITYDHPDDNFTQVPNELLDCPFLTGAEKITWIQLARVCRNGVSHANIRSVADVARALDKDPKRLRTELTRLRQAGGLVKESGDIRLVIPTEQPPEPTIEDEVLEQPKRKHRIDQKEAWSLIKEGWNKDKPEAWHRLDGGFLLPVYIAFETHAVRLNIEREDYGRFAAQLCRGASADAWWGKQPMKASSVFGWGKVNDKKFENVEKLYKLGASVESGIDYACDADILGRYHEKGQTGFDRVLRFEVSDRDEAEKHLYAIPDEDFSETTVYLYFAPGKEKPVHWSRRNLNSTRYLFT